MLCKLIVQPSRETRKQRHEFVEQHPYWLERGGDWQSGCSNQSHSRGDGNPAMTITINDIQAAGLTPMQLRNNISTKLTEYLPNPEVSVIVREVNHFKISVLGEVKKPGRYDFKGQATVLEAIATAGGLSDFAARSKITILRQENGTSRRIPVNYNKIVSSAEGGDVRLRPGDVVLVP
jgi:polysaccharide export outer membrane protein